MTMGEPDDLTVFQPTDALEMEAVTKFLADNPLGSVSLVAADGVRTQLPDQVYRLLATACRGMLHGKAIRLETVNQRLTTQQAADLLDVSRPTLIKLLEQGEIPFEQPTGSRHRRVKLNDVIAYREHRKAETRSLLDEMTRQAAADGLYATTTKDYRDTLDEARHALRQRPE